MITWPPLLHGNQLPQSFESHFYCLLLRQGWPTKSYKFGLRFLTTCHIWHAFCTFAVAVMSDFLSGLLWPVISAMSDFSCAMDCKFHVPGDYEVIKNYFWLPPSAFRTDSYYLDSMQPLLLRVYDFWESLSPDVTCSIHTIQGSAKRRGLGCVNSLPGSAWL